MENQLNYILDIKRPSYKVEKCKQLDTRPMVLTIYNNELPYNLADSVLELRAKKPDGTFVIQNNNITISNNVATINPLSLDIVRSAGIVKLELKITKGTNSILTNTFKLEILEGVIQENDSQSKNIITMTEEIDNLVEAITLNMAAAENKKQELITEQSNAEVKKQELITEENKLTSLIGTVQDAVIYRNTGFAEIKYYKQYVSDEIDTNIFSIAMPPNARAIIEFMASCVYSTSTSAVATAVKGLGTCVVTSGGTMASNISTTLMNTTSTITRTIDMTIKLVNDEVNDKLNFVINQNNETSDVTLPVLVSATVIYTLGSAPTKPTITLL